MFEYLYSSGHMPGFFRLFGYVSFRALLAGLSAMAFCFLFGGPIIAYLRKLKFGEEIRSDGPRSHMSKAGTPTMGGIMILLSLTISCLLFGNFKNTSFVLMLVCTLCLGGIGFMDDYSKVVLKKKGGMNARMKMILTLFVALFFCLCYNFLIPEPSVARKIEYSKTGLFLPFVKGQLVDLTPWFALPFWMIVVVGSAHGVNLTDGLDGLAIGNVAIVAVTFGILAYITGSPRVANYLNVPAADGAHELAVFLAALTGAGVGFLWFNAAPALVFMGDTGSLALGGSLGMAAVLLKKEILLGLAGGIFVAEAVSVILQVASFKSTGKRIFKMSPLHHHFELSGWPETRVVVRFWLIGVILALISLSSLRIQ